MRIGFDLDGVLANFPKAYQALYVELTGQDYFKDTDADNPPSWDWDLERGYTKPQRREVWDNIVLSNSFWRELEPLPGVKALDPLFPAIEDHHDIYFITSRAGKTAKRQSEDWVKHYLGYDERFGCSHYAPTVLIVNSEDKGHAAKALNLTVFIDDKLENVVTVKEAVRKCRTYLLDRRYNQSEFWDAQVIAQKEGYYTRVHSVQEFVERELDNL